MRGNYWLAMDINGTLYVYCDDCSFRQLLPPDDSTQYYVRTADDGKPILPARKPRPYRFDGSECVTAECLPEWAIDNYYAAELPKSLKESCGR